eukprot:gene5357-6683_t
MSGGELRFSLAERKAGSMQTPSAGNNVVVTNQQEFQDAIQNVHTSNSTQNWILVGYDGSPDRIKLISTGTGGVTELTQQLNDESMLYAIVRVVDVVDNIPTDRYAYITWIGDNVKGIDKARFGTNKSSVTKLLGHYNVEIIASSHNEISESEIMKKVQDASGSRIRAGEAGPVQNKTWTPKTTGTTTKSPPMVNTSNVHLTYNNESNLKSIIQEVKDPKNSINWMLIGYEGNNETLGLVGKGIGGLQELVSNLSANNVNYGIVKVEDKIDNSEMVKLAYIQWVGQSVSPMVKGKTTSHKGNVSEFFAPVHVTLFGESPTDLTDNILASKIQALKGMKK